MSEGKPKVILVACGRAVAASALMAREIREGLAQRGVQVTTIQCRTADLLKHAGQADLVVTTAPAPPGLDIHVITTLAFLTGIGVDHVIEEIISRLGTG